MDDPIPRRVLSDLAVVGEASTDKRAELVEVDEPGLVQRCLRWADLLRLVSPTTAGRWRLDSAVARLLRAASE